MATYPRTSPWHTTPLNSLYLETMQYRSIPNLPSDDKYTIEPQYTHRPDLLAYDLYGTPKLWWVFAVRNRDILSDPVYDFLPGTDIFCPKKQQLFLLIER